MLVINKQKSFGLGASRIGFFEAVWHIIGKDITQQVLLLFENCKMLRENSTTILAPKVSNP